MGTGVWSIIRTESGDVIDYPVCGACMPDALKEANEHADDYGYAHAAAIKTDQHNRQERCSRCDRVVKRTPNGGNREFGNHWTFA